MVNLPLSPAQKYWQLHPEQPQNLPYNWNAIGPIFWTARAVCVLTYKYCLLIIYGANRVLDVFLTQLKNLDPNASFFFHGLKTLDQYDICFLSVPEINQFKEKLLLEIRSIDSIAQRIALCRKMTTLFHPVIALASEEYKRDAIAEVANAICIDLGAYERQQIVEQQRLEQEQAERLQHEQEEASLEPPQEEIEAPEAEPEVIFCDPPQQTPVEYYESDSDDEDLIEEPEQEVNLNSSEQDQLELLRQEQDQKRFCRFLARLRKLEKIHPFSAAIKERLRSDNKAHIQARIDLLSSLQDPPLGQVE